MEHCINSIYACSIEKNAAVCKAKSQNQILQFYGYVLSQMYVTKSALFWPSNSGVTLFPEAELQTRQLERQN